MMHFAPPLSPQLGERWRWLLCTTRVNTVSRRVAAFQKWHVHINSVTDVQHRSYNKNSTRLSRRATFFAFFAGPAEVKQTWWAFFTCLDSMNIVPACVKRIDPSTRCSMLDRSLSCFTRIVKVFRDKSNCWKSRWTAHGRIELDPATSEYVRSARATIQHPGGQPDNTSD